ncbi:GntR family transcriptional regulator [bacterium]|nr:GntR family transcriptional regulator [bacterium]
MKIRDRGKKEEAMGAHDEITRPRPPAAARPNGNSPKPQYLRIADDLEKRIRTSVYAPNDPLPTFNELCAEYQVSLATVNKAIQELDSRGCVIRVRGKGVFAASREHRESSDGKAATAHMSIGLVIPDLANPYFASMAKKIQALLHAEQYTVITHSTDGSLQLWNQYLNRLISNRVNGIIIVPLDTSGTEKEIVLWRLKIARIPFIYMNSNYPRVPTDYVKSDVSQGVRDVAEYLVSLGHTRFGCISAQPFMNLTRKKMDVFRDALHEHGIELREEDMIVSSFEHDEGGHEAARHLLSRPVGERPTAIFATNDVIAFGVTAAAKDLGLKVPDDVSVVGFDNIEATRFTSPPLTTVEQPVDRISAKAAELILKRIQGKLPADFQEHIFRPQFIERGSCRPFKETNSGKK